MRDVFTYVLTDVVESGAAESWTSPITNRPIKQNPSTNHPRNEAGRWEHSGGGGKGKGRNTAKEGRRGRENHRNFEGKGV